MSEKRKKSSFFTLFWLVWLILPFGVVGCGNFGSSTDSPSKLPPFDVRFQLSANDLANNDSAKAHLVSGTLLRVYPNAFYRLSFDIDSLQKAPQLNLFRVVDSHVRNLTRSITPKEENGRWIYEFVCEENEPMYWVTTLERNGDYFRGQVQNVLFEGAGNYSNHFSVNLIVAGEYGGTADSVSADSLAKLLQREFRKNFSPGQIFIDTVYLHRASERIDLATAYPDNEPWLAGKSSEDFFVTELGGWPNSSAEPEIYNALDIVLVHRIEKTAVLGYSMLFSGNFGGGSGSTVLVGTHYRVDSRTEKMQTSEDIVNTAIHESAHFLGLRHTTATTSDIISEEDMSNCEDGIDDTPFCGNILNMKRAAQDSLETTTDYEISTWARPRLFFKEVAHCPDENNPMFPAETLETISSFTPGQLAYIARMLSLYPH